MLAGKHVFEMELVANPRVVIRHMVCQGAFTVGFLRLSRQGLRECACKMYGLGDVGDTSYKWTRFWRPQVQKECARDA